jgi:hypothetical protein
LAYRILNFLSFDAFGFVVTLTCAGRALLSGAGAPCAWLSLGMTGDSRAPAMLVAQYLTALLAAPLTLYLIVRIRL